MRIRESSSWITKHNDQISSTGSLRVGGSSSKALQGEKSRQPRICKGFACRSWASEFLSDEYLDNEGECTPFTVRRYVDRSRNSSSRSTRAGRLQGTCKSPKNSERAKCFKEGSEVKSDNEHTTKEYDPSETTPLSGADIKEQLEERDREQSSMSCIETLSPQTSDIAATKFVCSCKADSYNVELFRDRIACCLGESRSAKTIRSSRRSKTLGAALPVKQFPPIDPLQEVKKMAAQKRQIPRERPRTVDTAFMAREMGRTPGRSDSCSREEKDHPSNSTLSMIIGQRISCCPPSSQKEHQEREKLRPLVPRGAASHLEMADDEVLQLLAYDVEKWSANDSDTSSVKSISRYRMNTALNVLPAGLNFRSRHRNPNTLKTPPQSPSSKDWHDSMSESSDTGLGSEFELSPDGSTRLDVFLKPRTVKMTILQL